MPPAVATPNVFGEFQEDIKGFGGLAWGRRVNGSGSDQMVVTPSRNSALQGPGTTAQRIMAANGIKAPKRPPPLKVPPPPQAPPPLPPQAAIQAPAPSQAAAAAAGSAAPVLGVPSGVPVGPGPPPLGLAVGLGSFTGVGSSSGKQRPPKLAAVIEERQPRGCCAMGFFSRGASRPAASSPRPGPANDPLPPPHDVAPVGPRALTMSTSGRGAPSVLSTSFRQANHSIKRVPQSARSNRGASARSQRGASATRSDNNTALSNWDDVSEGEYGELEDFIDDDNDSIARDHSNASLAAASSFSTTFSRAASRAASSAIAAYRESTAGNKAAPKSILKSAKRDSKQVVVAYSADGAPMQSELAGRSRVMLADGAVSDGGSPTGGMPTYGANVPPGYTSNSLASFRPSPVAGPSQVMAPAAAGGSAGPGAPGGPGPAAVGWSEGGAVGGGAGGAAAEWQSAVAVARSGGSVPGVRNGPASIKLTAEELLGLLMAQGKLTETDVQELGLTAGVDPRGSPGQPASSPSSVAPSRFGSAGGGCSPVPFAGPGPVPAGLVSQSAGNSASPLHPAEAGGGGGGVGAWGAGPQPFLSQLRGAETNSSMARVRFSASQVPTGADGVGGAGGGGAQSGPVLTVSASHRVRFGDDEPQPQPGAAAATAAVAAAAVTTTTPVVAVGPAAGPSSRALGGARLHMEPSRSSATNILPNTGSAGSLAPTPAATAAASAAAMYSSAPPATIAAASATAAAAAAASNSTAYGTPPRPSVVTGSCPASPWNAAAGARQTSPTGGAGGGTAADGFGRGSNAVPVAEDSEAAQGLLAARPSVPQSPRPPGPGVAGQLEGQGQAVPHQQHPHQHQQQHQHQHHNRRQKGRDFEESLDLDEVLNSTVLKLESQPPGPRPLPTGASATGGASPHPPAAPAPATTTASRSPRSDPHAEALLRLGPPGSPSPPSLTSPVIPAGLAAYRGPMLRSSDSGVMRVAGTPTVAATAAAGAGQQGAGAGASPRHNQVLRLSGTGPPLLASPSGTSRPGSAGSNTSVTPFSSHWGGPHGSVGGGVGGGGGSVSAGGASAVSLTAPGDAAGLGAGGAGVGVRAAADAGAGYGGRAGGGGGSAGVAGGGGLGAVDRLAMRKLQSHMSRGTTSSRHTVSSGGGGGGDSMTSRPPGAGPLRQPSRSNWIYSSANSSTHVHHHHHHPELDSEDQEGPGTPDQEGADARRDASAQQQLLGRPSGRSVRFTAPVVFELQQSSSLDDDTSPTGGVGGGAATGRAGARRGGGRHAGVRRQHWQDDNHDEFDDEEEEDERDAVAAAAAAAARSRSMRMQQELDLSGGISRDDDGTGPGLAYQPTSRGLDGGATGDKGGAWV